MAVHFRCPNCQQKYSAPDDSAGKRIQCKKCGMEVIVPRGGAKPLGPATGPRPAAPSPPAASAASSGSGLSSLLDEALAEEAPAAAPEPLAAGAAPQTFGPRFDLDEEPRARPRRRNKPGWLGNFHIDNISITAAVIAGVCFFMMWREGKLASLARSEPQRLTVQELVAKGPGDNIHLELSGLRLMVEHCVVKTHEHGPNPKRWSLIWIPVLPAEQGAAPLFVAGQVRVIMQSSHCHTDQDLDDFERRTSFRGMIVNATNSLGSEEKKLLGQGLPGTDLSNCYIFQEGVGPKVWLAQLTGIAGVIAALVAVGACFRPRSES